MLLTPFSTNKVCESDILVVVLPLHTIPTFIHQPDEILPAGSCLFTVQHRKGYILHIAFNFPLFRLFQKLVRFFLPCNGFFPFFSLKGLSLFRHVQALFPALLIATLFQIFQVVLAPLELVAVLIVHRIDYEMRVYMVFVLMSSHKHFKPFPCRRILGKL